MPESLEKLRAIEDACQPTGDAKKDLRDTTLVPIIGPIAVGKSACIDSVLTNDEQFGRAQSFTSRPPRPGESANQYRFIPHTEESINEIFNKASAGELVQIKVHPTLGYIYGTEPSDYKHRFVLLDIMAEGMEAIRKLPFKEITEISLVTTPEEWIKRFSTRKMTKNEAQMRLEESRNSLIWSLDQGDYMRWVYNEEGQLSRASMDVRHVALGRDCSCVRGREIGGELLRFMTKYHA